MLNDLADVVMEGVKPAGEFKELSVGKYLVRVEDVGKKAAKDKFDKSTGLPDPDNGKCFMLCIDLKVYRGPDEGHTETENLNLWRPLLNPNEPGISSDEAKRRSNSKTAIEIAKSTLLAFQQATGVFSSSSRDFLGKWLELEVYLNRVGKPARKYSAVPASYTPTDVPPVSVTSKYGELQNQSNAAPAPQARPAYVAPVYSAPAPQAASPSATPDWAHKRRTASDGSE